MYMHCTESSRHAVPVHLVHVDDVPNRVQMKFDMEIGDAETRRAQEEYFRGLIDAANTTEAALNDEEDGETYKRLEKIVTRD